MLHVFVSQSLHGGGSGKVGFAGGTAAVNDDGPPRIQTLFPREESYVFALQLATSGKPIRGELSQEGVVAE